MEVIGDASQTRQNKPRAQEGRLEGAWHTKLVGDLRNVMASLGEKEGVQKEVEALGEVLAGLEQARGKLPATSGVEARLDRIEVMLRQT
jgi:hypothetical protein